MSAHTPGPWDWFATDGGRFHIATPDRGHLVVMDFARCGMHGAQPRFAVMDDDLPRGRRGGILVDAKEIIAKHGKLDHPDATLIVAAPDLYAALKGLLASEDQTDEVTYAEEISLRAERVAAAREAIAAAEGRA